MPCIVGIENPNLIGVFFPMPFGQEMRILGRCEGGAKELKNY